jgi:LPS-assembly lipoprotein
MRHLALGLCLVVAACGFKLRGTADVPFDTVYVPGATGGIGRDLARNIQAGTRAKVTQDPKTADAIMEFLADIRQKEILSLSGTGRVREYQLRYRFAFRVHDGKGAEYVAPSTIQLTRDITFNDSDVLAKESEEAFLWRDMQNDMVQQIMRRLAAAQKPVPRVP